MTAASLLAAHASIPFIGESIAWWSLPHIQYELSFDLFLFSLLGLRVAFYFRTSWQARSTMEYLMFLLVTGESTSPATQLPSQGAGQTRPVNSGKLLVLCSRSMASAYCPSYSSKFHSSLTKKSAEIHTPHHLHSN